MADDFIDDEDDLSSGRLSGHNGGRGHSGLEQSHGHDGGNEDEDGGEEERDAGVDYVRALEADHGGEVLHDLDIRVIW